MKGITITLAQAEAHQKKHGFIPNGLSSVPTAPPARQKALRGSRQPNLTEREYGLILADRKGITVFFYEGITLHWGDGMKYTPDYVCYGPLPLMGKPLLIEVKGNHVRDRDIVRFKGCRAEWKRYYDFEMHQKQKGVGWVQIL